MNKFFPQCLTQCRCKRPPSRPLDEHVQRPRLRPERGRPRESHQTHTTSSFRQTGAARERVLPWGACALEVVLSGWIPQVAPEGGGLPSQLLVQSSNPHLLALTVLQRLGLQSESVRSLSLGTRGWLE